MAAARRATKAAATKTAAAAGSVIWRPRYMAHIGLLAIVGTLVVASNPQQAHDLSLNLAASNAAQTGPVLDEVATAKMAAAIADKSNLVVTAKANETAEAKSQQVALLTSDDDALAKRQVAETAANPTSEISEYEVVSGDTLTELANRYQVTTATIKWANNLDDADMIAPGQKLTILPTSGLLYTLAEGDTSQKLADSYKANAAQILSYNNLADDAALKPGEKIIIPDGVKPEPVKPKVQVAATTAPTTGQVAGASTAAPKLTSYSGGGNTYSMGYCTYYGASRRSVPSGWGNANQWYYNAQAAGFSVGSTPVPGAIAWSSAGYAGHVAYVEAVNGNSVTISEMNYNGDWNRVSSRTVSAGSFLYIY